MTKARSSEMVASDGSLANAEECLAAASALLQGGSPPRFAYHLALLGLEEIGKARILRMKFVGDLVGRDTPTSIDRRLDDHVHKLFWGIFGGAMGGSMTPAKFQENVGLATTLHEKRIAGLYVDRLESGEVALPTEVNISSEETSALLEFVRAVLELAKADAIDEGRAEQAEAQERIRWFFNITDDPEARRYVFGRTSMAKLSELESVPKWADWIREKFAEAEAEAKATIDAELQRQPDASDKARPRWRFTMRIHSTSHSIRQKVLNDTNSGLKWITMRAVSGKHDQFLLDLEAFSDIPTEAIWGNQLLLARLTVMALNVSTLGFFWFHEPLDVDELQSGKFFEKLVNIETKREIRASRNPPLRLQFGKRRVLERADLGRWTLCVVHLMEGVRDPQKSEMAARYLDGLTMIAKTDVHMGFEIQSVAAFYLALRTAMRVYGSVADDAFPDALRKFVNEEFKKADDDGHIERLIDVGEALNTGTPVKHPMTMNDVGVMKAICDVYLIRTFQKLGLPERPRKRPSTATEPA